MGYAQANGKYFTPVYRINGNRHWCRADECGKFTDKAAAEAHANECEAKARQQLAADQAWRDENPDPADHELSPSQKAKLTVADVWTRYCSEVGPTIELKTLESYANAMRLRVLPKWGTKRPDAIDRGDVGTWLSVLKNKERASAATIRSTLLAFSSLMKFAVEQKIRTDGVNPCRGHKIEKVVREKREEDFELTPVQLASLIAAFPTPGLKLATATMAGTGVRFEELAALRVGCLDFKRCTIFIERRVTWPKPNEARGHTGGPVEHPNTKSKGVRKFKIRPHLAQQLEQWIKDNGLKKGELIFPHDLVCTRRSGYGCTVDDSDVPELTEEFIATLGTIKMPNGYEYKHGTIGGATTGRCRCTYCRAARLRYDRARRLEKGRKATLIVSRNPERYLRHETYLAAFHKAVAKARLDEELDWTPTPHCLRHTYITRLANSGVPLTEVQRRAGHQDIATTMGYVHPNTATDQAAADALGAEYDIDLREVG